MFPFEIIDKENNSFIGVFLIKLDLYNEDSYEFTVYLDEKYWNKGVYTEIVPYMVSFSFEEIIHKDQQEKNGKNHRKKGQRLKGLQKRLDFWREKC